MVAIGTTGSVAGLLTFGTVSSLISKIVYEMESEGLDGKQHYFRKPWMMTTIMFLGMTACLPLAYLEERAGAKAPAADSSAQDPLLESDRPAEAPRSRGQELRESLLLAIPTLFDLIATVLMNIGLLSVTASVYQMMRGAEMVFAAGFAITFLRRRLNALHYGGILLCIAGITLVGYSSVQSGQGGSQVPVAPAQILIGMLLIVLSQAVQAAQITFEDYFMSEMAIAPMKIVGFEGLFGTIIMLGVMAPIVRLLPGEEGGGVHEDIADTLHMIWHSGPLAATLAFQMFALLAYNYMGMHVTGHLGAVFRTVLETMRTLFVWLLGLALFYLGTGLGESWNAWSYLQAAGFVVLVCGTSVYGRGDERAGKLAVEEMLQEARTVEGDMEESAGAVRAAPGGGVAAVPPTLPTPAAPAPASSAMAIVSPSPHMRAQFSMAAGSYQEAVASSLRSRGIDPDSVSGSFHR